MVLLGSDLFPALFEVGEPLQLPCNLVDLARVVGQIACIVEFARQFVGRHVRQFVVGAPSLVERRAIVWYRQRSR